MDNIFIIYQQCKTYRAYLYNDQTDYVHTVKSLNTFKVQNVKKKPLNFTGVQIKQRNNANLNLIKSIREI